MKEQWRDIPDFEGLYQVSDRGRVRSLDSVRPHAWSGTKTYKGCVLSPSRNKRDDYLRVHLYPLGGQKSTEWLVHRLVLTCFVGPCPESLEAAHEDGNKRNNFVENLTWKTRSANEHDKVRHGVKGRRVRRSDGAEFRTITEAGRATGINIPDICMACRGQLKTAGGFRWSYA